MKNKEEIYQSIVDDIKGMYGGKLSDVAAHEASRNLIEFVKILLEHYEETS